MKITYYVESPWIDRSRPDKKQYPLTKVTVRELKNRVHTKTGRRGRGVTVTIAGWNGDTVTAHSVCCPPDRYSLTRGAKLAMGRALDSIPKITKEFRKSIWQGLFAEIGT